MTHTVGALSQSAHMQYVADGNRVSSWGTPCAQLSKDSLSGIALQLGVMRCVMKAPRPTGAPVTGH